MGNHTGLRGGNSMEAYLNFGIVGIVVFNILSGYFYGCLERWFNRKYVKTKSKKTEYEFFIALILCNLFSLFTCSAGFFNFYVDLLFYCIIILVSSLSVSSKKTTSCPHYEETQKS